MSKSGFFGLLVLPFALAQAAMAQTTLFNIPTTDVVAKRKVYLEFDFLPQIPAESNGVRGYFYNPRLLAGLGGDVEAGVNFPVYQRTTICSSAPVTPVTCSYFQLNLKWRFYNNSGNGVALASGTLWHEAMNHRSTHDAWGLVYVLVSKKFHPGNSGPRITGGPYAIVSGNQNPAAGPVSFMGPRAGVILGYEQPVDEKVNVVAEWFSGKNFFGLFTPGVMITMPGDGVFGVGYSIGNDSWTNHNAVRNRYLYIFYGVTF